MRAWTIVTRSNKNQIVVGTINIIRKYFIDFLGKAPKLHSNNSQSSSGDFL